MTTTDPSQPLADDEELPPVAAYLVPCLRAEVHRRGELFGVWLACFVESAKAKANDVPDEPRDVCAFLRELMLIADAAYDHILAADEADQD